MLKKAGIVVATAAAGLLAVSPLAFAGDMGHGSGDMGYHHGHNHHGSSHSEKTTYDHSPSCNSAPQTVGNYNPQTATGVASLLGFLATAANVAAPVTTQLQTPILSCNNLQDLANVDVHDNFQDNSRTRTETNHSFNTR